MIDPGSPATFHTPHDLLGAAPYLVGYHPSDELVAIFTDTDQRIIEVAALPLDEPPEALIEHLAVRMPGCRAAGVVLIGYGSRWIRNRLTAVGEVTELLVPVRALLQVTGSRCVCLLKGCTCPATAGVDFDPATSRVAARLTVEGMVALPSRQALHSLVAPDATGQAEIETALAALPAGYEPVAKHIEYALAQAEHGGRPSVEQAAKLAVALAKRDLHTAAWQATSGHMWQRDLWLDLTRRMPERYVTGPASLAAWCAWRRGEHALAGFALRRAQQARPGDALTRLIGWILGAHLPAHHVAWPPKDLTGR